MDELVSVVCIIFQKFLDELPVFDGGRTLHFFLAKPAEPKI